MYSGNVASLAQAAKYSEAILKDYLFNLISGPVILKSSLLLPKDFASAGFFVNHADSKTKRKKINVKALIALQKNNPIVLMQASKKIDNGEELLYDYNREYSAIDTRDFG